MTDIYHWACCLVFAGGKCTCDFYPSVAEVEGFAAGNVTVSDRDKARGLLERRKPRDEEEGDDE